MYHRTAEKREARFAGDSRTHSLSSPLSPGVGVVKPRSTTKAQHEYKCQGRSRSGLFNLWRKRKKLNRFTESGDKSIYAHCVRLWDSTLTPKSQILGILELQRLYWNTKATRLRGRNEAMQGATHPGQTFQGRCDQASEDDVTVEYETRPILADLPCLPALPICQPKIYSSSTDDQEACCAATNSSGVIQR